MERVLKTWCLTITVLILTAGLAWAGRPQPIYPAKNATGVPRLPTLEWTAVDPIEGEDGEITYYVEMTADPACSLTGQTDWAATSSDTHWSVPRAQALPPDTLVYWRVRACETAYVDHDGDPLTPLKAKTTCTWGPKQVKDPDTGELDPSSYWTFTTVPYAEISEISPPWPSLARPTYAVYLYGCGFGDIRGAVKLGNAKRGFKFINGEWGKIVKWTNDQIIIVLPCYQCWGDWLPGIFKVIVIPADDPATPENEHKRSINAVKIQVTYGGGGTTW